MKNLSFEKWLKEISACDGRYAFLPQADYKDERMDFYTYFEEGLSPQQALQREYEEYG